MLEIAQLLDSDRIHCKQDLSSKKRALESLATLLSTFSEEHTHMDILDSLSARERIGGTGLGHVSLSPMAACQTFRDQSQQLLP